MMKQRRLSQLGLGAGLATMVLGAMMAIAPGAGAEHTENHDRNPHGNNGTVKIDGLHELDGPGHGPGPNEPGQHPDNDPHVECAFELEFFGFDTGQLADIVITSHAPTRGENDPLLSESKVLISDDSAGPADGENPDRDAVLTYDLMDELASIEPHDVHGWHVKLSLTLYNADETEVPGGQKHKVFWIEDCRPEQPPAEMGIELVKTNDADRDEDFTDSEVAPASGEDVTFRLDITNTGDVPLTIESLEDIWPGRTEALDLLQEDLDCTRGGADADLADELPAGSTTTCFFTVEDYAPPAGTSLENEVTVVTEEGPEDDDTSTVTSPELSYSIELTKDNDADEDEDFTDSEVADTAGEDVRFRIVLENTGTGDLTIDSLMDRWGDEELDLLDPEDVDLDCTRGEGEEETDVDLITDPILPAGSTTTCFFTVTEYAPAAGGSLVNTVIVTTDEDADDEDDSTVSTPPTSPTYSVDLEKRNDADGNGTFSDSERAATAGSPVTFEVRIENTGNGHLTLVSLEDVWGSNELDLLDPDTGLSCTRGGRTVVLQVGGTLPAGSVTVCTFTVSGYAPGAGGTVINTVTIDTEQTAPVDDDSTVTGPETQQVPPPPPPGPTPTYSVAVDKVNDADDDGDFSPRETAEDAGDDVEFQVTIRNTGTGGLVLNALTDRVPGRGTIDLLGDDVDLVCTGAVTDLRVGSFLPAGSTTVCTFVLEDYAPRAGDFLTNVVTVVTDRDSDTDRSTVDTEEEVSVLPAPPVVNPPTQTPPPAVAPIGGPPAVSPIGQPAPAAPAALPAPAVRGDVVTRALPRTGDDTRDLTGMGAFLIAVGAAMVLGSRRQLARR